MEKERKPSSYQNAVSYLYKKTPTKRKPALFKTFLFPQKDVPPDGAILLDGTEVRLVPTNLTKGRPLYVSDQGKGYAYKNGLFQAIKDQELPRRKSNYHIFRRFNNVYVHKAVLSAWDGPCPPGYECDHINGDPTDNRLENLEYVTPAENTRRRWISHLVKGENYNGKKLTEIGKRAWLRRKKTAERYGVSIDLIIETTTIMTNNEQ